MQIAPTIHHDELSDRRDYATGLLVPKRLVGTLYSPKDLLETALSGQNSYFSREAVASRAPWAVAKEAWARHQAQAAA